MARRPLIAGNWKMYKTTAEAVADAQALARRVAQARQTDILIAPPFTALAAVAQSVSGSNVAVGAQNLHWETQGAFTGEISPTMVKAAGATHAIIGHSERRQFFGETDDTVNRKIKAAVAHGLIPVMCVGEMLSEREADQTFSVLDKQVRNGLKGRTLDELDRLVLAYEPVWAIGTGKTASADQAQEVHVYLRGLLAEIFGSALAGSVRILYGGSVKPGNIGELMAMADIDGALVGGASLDPDTFSTIVAYDA